MTRILKIKIFPFDFSELKDELDTYIYNFTRCNTDILIKLEDDILIKLEDEFIDIIESSSMFGWEDDFLF